MQRWNTWGGQGGFVLPCDEGFTPCMFNRQTYGPKPNSRAHLPQPDYVQWGFWQRHFTSFITLCSSHCGHLSYCCWWVQLRPQIVRSNKEGTRVSPAVIKIGTAKSTLSLHIHIVWYTQHFSPFSRIWAPTHTSVFGLGQLGWKWLIAMATVCAALLQLWYMWWHFWPSSELCNAVGCAETR